MQKKQPRLITPTTTTSKQQKITLLDLQKQDTQVKWKRYPPFTLLKLQPNFLFYLSAQLNKNEAKELLDKCFADVFLQSNQT